MNPDKFFESLIKSAEEHRIEANKLKTDTMFAIYMTSCIILTALARAIHESTKDTP